MINKPYILILDKDEVTNKYLDLGTIKAVAHYYNANSSTMARFFKRYNIEYIQKHKNNFNESFFYNDSANAFYLAGFIAADGNISNQKYRITIELAEKDLDFLERMKCLINYNGDLIRSVVKNSKRDLKWKDTVNYSLKFSSKQVVEDLSRFNIVSRKTKIYDFPDWLINHPLVNHFMRGYFDGDGHIGLKKTKLRFHLSGNYVFLTNFQYILERECDIAHNNIFTRPNGLSCLEYQGNIIASKIYQFLYNNSTFHLDRKYKVYKDFLESFSNDKKSI